MVKFYADLKVNIKLLTSQSFFFIYKNENRQRIKRSFPNGTRVCWKSLVYNKVLKTETLLVFKTKFLLNLLSCLFINLYTL